MIITISGFAGSGKTTVAKQLAEKTGYRYISAGEIFRSVARDRGMSLEALLSYAEKNPGVDRELDKRVIELTKEGNAVVEGRLIGWLAKQYGLSAVRIWLEASLDIRARRLAKRENKPVNVILEEIQKRESSDWQRFWDLYTININDISVYSLVVDTTYLTPEQVVSAILQKIRDDRVAL